MDSGSFRHPVRASCRVATYDRFPARIVSFPNRFSVTVYVPYFRCSIFCLESASSLTRSKFPGSAVKFPSSPEFDIPFISRGNLRSPSHCLYRDCMVI